MKFIRHLVLSLAVATAALAADSAPGDKQSTPEGAFELFKEYLLAKDKDGLRKLIISEEEDITKNLARLDQMPEEEKERVKSASITEKKIEGDIAIGLIKVTRDGKTRYDDQFFILREGKWHPCMKPSKFIPTETVSKLRGWYIERKTALSPQELRPTEPKPPEPK